MNKDIVLKSFFILGVFSFNGMIAMDEKQHLAAPLVSTPSISDQKATQEGTHTSNKNAKKTWCCLASSCGILAAIITGVVFYNKGHAAPSRPGCDNLYLTAQDFANSPNMTWAQTLDNCCFTSGSQTIIGDASVFSGEHEKETLGEYAFDVAYANDCDRTALCSSNSNCIKTASPSACPTIKQASVDKNSPNYFKNFKTPCSKHRSKKSRFERKIAMTRDKQQRSKAQTGRAVK